MDYFSFYKIKESFLLDESALRRLYLQLSREYHPDFFTLADEAEQAKILELSTFNNEAYKTLNDFELRMAYILRLHDFLDEEDTKNQIPTDFLMEMMDLNEALMELEFDFDKASFIQIKTQFTDKKERLYAQILPALEKFEWEADKDAYLKQVQVYYLKMRYINRLEKKMQGLELENGS